MPSIPPSGSVPVLAIPDRIGFLAAREAEAFARAAGRDGGSLGGLDQDVTAVLAASVLAVCSRPGAALGAVSRRYGARRL